MNLKNPRIFAIGIGGAVALSAALISAGAAVARDHSGQARPATVAAHAEPTDNPSGEPSESPEAAATAEPAEKPAASADQTDSEANDGPDVDNNLEEEGEHQTDNGSHPSGADTRGGGQGAVHANGSSGKGGDDH